MSTIAIVHIDEIIPGKKLGQGCFSDVYAMEEFRPLPERNENLSEAEKEARLQLNEYKEGKASESSDTNPLLETDIGSSQKYAIKSIKQDFGDAKMFRLAAKDLETEINILTKLDNPNIIKLYAKSMNANSSKNCTLDNARHYFIIMDRLSCTLTQKIDEWILEEARSISNPFSMIFGGVNVKDKLFLKRLHVLHDLSSALAYLHEENFIYRDLKADNVGFDFSGKCKLFDFGLARELPEKLNNENEKFAMSGKTGSVLLMSPEVFKGQPYNQKADVYSFAILVWSVLSLELPYLDFIRERSFESKVMERGMRPKIFIKWPDKLRSLLNSSWAQQSDMRPSIEKVQGMIKEVIDIKSSDLNRQGKLKIVSLLLHLNFCLVPNIFVFDHTITYRITILQRSKSIISLPHSIVYVVPYRALVSRLKLSDLRRNLP